MSSTRDVRHMNCMVLADYTTSSAQLTAHSSTARGVSLCAQFDDACCKWTASKISYIEETLTPAAHETQSMTPAAMCSGSVLIGTDMQMDNESFILAKPALIYNIIRIRRYADGRYLTDCIIKRHNGLTPMVMVSRVRLRNMVDHSCYE